MSLINVLKEKTQFKEKFNLDFKDKMFLLDTDEFLENNVFGIIGKENYMKYSLGEYISICKMVIVL